MKQLLIACAAILILTSQSSASLTPGDRDTLNFHFPILAQSWVQTSVDRCNQILANESYDYLDWNEYFGQYFSSHPLTQPLWDYMGYPTFWWFSDNVHRNLQNGLMLPFMTKIDTMIAFHYDSLASWMNNDADVRSTMQLTNHGLSYMLFRPHIDQISRSRIDSFYTHLIESFPGLLRSDITFSPATDPYLVSLRSQAQLPLLETQPLTESRKNTLADLFGLTGLRDSLFIHYDFLLFDNNGFSDSSIVAIDRYFSTIPRELYDLDYMSAIDFWGPRYTVWAEWGINVFAEQVRSGRGNHFPRELNPVCADNLMIVLAHEANHIVDAYYVANDNNLAARKSALISRAGNDSLQYLRSMFDPGFFVAAPQEFFASIANEWFDHSLHTLRLGIERFYQGYSEPINQALFYCDVYSHGTDSTRFYETGPAGVVNFQYVPIVRNGTGQIEELDVGNTRFLFSYDGQGYVTSCSMIEAQTDGTGRYLSLDGSGDYVSIPDRPELDIVGNYTLTVWVRSISSGYQRIASKDDGWPSPYWTFGLQNGQLELAVRNDQVIQVNVAGGPVINDGEWHHVGFTFANGQSIALFVDGSQVATASHSGTFSNFAALTLGSYCHYDQDFNGTLDELHIWNRTLDEIEILDDKPDPGNPEQNSLVGDWSFNDPDGLVWDDSPYEDHGTLVGDAHTLIGSLPGEQYVFRFDECSGNLAHEDNGAFNLQLNEFAQWTADGETGCALNMRTQGALATAVSAGEYLGNGWDELSAFASIKLLNPLGNYSPVLSRYINHLAASYYLIVGNEGGGFGALYAKVFTGPNDVGVTLASDPGMIVDTCWHQVGLSYARNDSMKLWLDGHVVASAATPDLPVKTTSATFQVGANNQLGFGNNFNGDIDNVLVSRTLPLMELMPLPCAVLAPNDLTIQLSGGSAVLNWSPVTEDSCGSPLCRSVNYVVWYEATENEDYDFLAVTPDTEFVHAGVLAFESHMFYYVTTYVGSTQLISEAVRILGPAFSKSAFDGFLRDQEGR